MSIFSLGFFGLFAASAGIASMTAAFEAGDRDEASRQGVAAGPAVIEQGLVSKNRATQLAAITAAPAVEARVELLPALATAANGGDRRTAIPAARAARAIARELAQSVQDGEASDELAPDDVATYRAEFDAVAKNQNRFIEVRILALDTVAALARVIDPTELGFDLAAALADPDPALRAIAIGNVPRPTPASARAPLANAVKNDADDKLALIAAQALCGDDPKEAHALLGAQGIDRIKTLVGGKPTRTTRDARRCLER